MRRPLTVLILLALWLAIPLAPALALTIAVDGQAGDWPAAAEVTPADAADPVTSGLDIRSVYYTNNGSVLFLRYDTATAAAWPNSTIICFNSSSLVTSAQVPSGCGGLTDVDFRLTISGTPSGANNGLTVSLSSCNSGGQCNQGVSATVLAASSAGTVTEIAVSLSAIGVTSPGLNAALDFTINTGGGSVDTARYDNLSLPSPTPVTLTALTVTEEAGGVRVAWRTATEFNTLGYHVLRSTSGAREDAAPITPDLILAEGDGVTGGSYTFLDPAPPPGAPARYWLEVWDTDGSRQEYGPVTTAPVVEEDATTQIYLPLLAR